MSLNHGGAPLPVINKKPFGQRVMANLRRDRWLYFMLIPGIIYYAIYKYGPMWGLLLGFKNYQPFLGFWGSKWVGLAHFQRFFGDRAFGQLFSNTIVLSLLNLLFNFPMPIVFALLLNEVRSKRFKKFVQTVSYLPHFMSWVVVVGITYVLFSSGGGIIYELVKQLTGQPVNFLSSARSFRPMIIGQSMWKETGWGTIIYLAALAGVELEQYEAARIDGANRFQQLLHITLPSIKPIVVTMLILRLGNILDSSFDQLYNMLNEMNYSVGEVFDTYVYKVGITLGQFSYSTAVGMFKSAVGLVLVLGADFLAKRLGEEGII